MYANNTLQHKQFLCKTVFGSIEWGLALLSSTGTLRFLRRCLHSHTQFNFALPGARLMKHSWSFINIFYLFHECLLYIFLSSEKISQRSVSWCLSCPLIIVILGFILWLVNKWSDCLSLLPLSCFQGQVLVESCQNKLIIRREYTRMSCNNLVRN